MSNELSEKLRQVKWHIFFAVLALAGLVFGFIAASMAAFKIAFLTVLYLAASVAIFAIIFLITEMIKSVKTQQERIEQINDSLTANKKLLDQISHGVKLSETAKKIAYRDMDRQQLRASVIEKLHQQDFDATYSMIEDIAGRGEYKRLAEELKVTADGYRDATDQERVNQIVHYIERLFEQSQWTAASVQIERLIKKYPDSKQAHQMSAKLAERKEQKKRELLSEWDKAVKKSDVDRSLLVLKELDLYLTPSEGLALQEAASEIFKNKLHNMGVQFSLAVSEKQWQKACKVGQEIVKEFPNSRIADEIRGKMPILKGLNQPK